MLSQPELPDDAVPFWDAFQDLDRDRQHEHLSLGMGGGVRLPETVPLEAIRADGRRRGYVGEELEIFALILRIADDHKKSVSWKKISDDLRKQAAKSKAR